MCVSFQSVRNLGIEKLGKIDRIVAESVEHYRTLENGEPMCSLAQEIYEIVIQLFQ